MKSIVLVAAIAALFALAVADPCCAPKRWEGEAFGYLEKSNVSFYEYIMYDFPNRRLRVDVGAELWNQDKKIGETVIQKMSPDGSVFRTYRINVQTGACTYEEGGFMKELCLDENPVFDFAYTIGGSLKAHSYFYDYTDHKGQSFTHEMTVSEDKCFPIKGLFMSHHNNDYRFAGEITYVNLVEGIRDPFSFQTPDDCQKVTKKF